MNTIFISSENFKTFDPSDYYSILQMKQTWEEKINILLYQILAFTIHGNTLTKSYKNKKLKISAQHGNKNLNYLMDHILYQIFKIILYIFLKSMEKKQLNVQ